MTIYFILANLHIDGKTRNSLFDDVIYMRYNALLYSKSFPLFGTLTMKYHWNFFRVICRSFYLLHLCLPHQFIHRNCIILQIMLAYLLLTFLHIHACAMYKYIVRISRIVLQNALLFYCRKRMKCQTVNRVSVNCATDAIQFIAVIDVLALAVG